MLRVWRGVAQVYQAYADYFDMMDLIEEMVTACALAVRHTLTFDYQVRNSRRPLVLLCR